MGSKGRLSLPAAWYSLTGIRVGDSLAPHLVSPVLADLPAFDLCSHPCSQPGPLRASLPPHFPVPASEFLLLLCPEWLSLATPHLITFSRELESCSLLRIPHLLLVLTSSQKLSSHSQTCSFLLLSVGSFLHHWSLTVSQTVFRVTGHEWVWCNLPEPRLYKWQTFNMEDMSLHWEKQFLCTPAQRSKVLPVPQLTANPSMNFKILKKGRNPFCLI